MKVLAQPSSYLSPIEVVLRELLADLQQTADSDADERHLDVLAQSDRQLGQGGDDVAPRHGAELELIGGGVEQRERWHIVELMHPRVEPDGSRVLFAGGRTIVARIELTSKLHHQRRLSGTPSAVDRDHERCLRRSNDAGQRPDVGLTTEIVMLGRSIAVDAGTRLASALALLAGHRRVSLSAPALGPDRATAR